ncbi:MAG: hypothetical protein NTV00_06840 [Methylococcales bacterium]|nr:hypothetical protein [Methylococcales bacterium]
MRKPIGTFIIIVLYALLCQSAAAEHDTEQADSWYTYHWGRGLTIPAANLNVGGYFKSAYAQQEQQPGVLSLEDFSLFITWTPHARLRFFAEIEQHDWLNNTDGVAPFTKKLSVERLFVDFSLTESASIRFGKFLTPFGRWNVIHSAPLVWTTNRPVITDDKSFAPRANGLMLNYTWIVNEHNLDVAFYLDDSTDLEPRSFNNVIFDKAAGVRVNYELTEELQIGGSYLAYQRLFDLGLPTHHLVGVDFMWQHQGYELLMESLYHVRDDPLARLEEKGLFLQGVVPLAEKVSAVTRYEYFNTNAGVFNEQVVSHIGVAGLAWRPYLPLVIKSEYRFGDNNKSIAPSGLFVSVAMFF